ncbi:MAG: phenylalanine--tRNA ligase subunit beta [Chloroflexota bacterium]|nr:phenylalanine--tRNA ligase subunit beta [Chloroflexota bacterium]
MRVPLSWLRDYVDVDLEPAALAARLTELGTEVKGIERWGADWQNVVVGELLTVERHPRADRLSLTTVTVGSGEPLSIVCGATNIAPGQRVPVALPGAVLPGGRQIERAEKMGVVSNGMLCSGEELRLTADGEGILILAADAPIGRPLSELYGDIVLDVDVKPNRGDVLSLVGLAREVAAVTGAEVRWPPTDPVEGKDDVASHFSVRVEASDLCPRFVGRWVDGLKVRPSPDRVQMRLLAAGMRPVSNVVDASNYVMLELGKPIHTFDAAAVGRGAGGLARLVVRLARVEERLETLDHVERILDSETLVIADEEKALAIAGIMGGAASEVSEGTRAVIIESAIFDPVSIRRTGQRYALRSEASLRFEKGQETRLARLGADRTAVLIHDWAGGTVARGRVDAKPEEPGPLRVAFRPGRVNRLLGTTLPPGQQRELLSRVGIKTEEAVAAELVPVAVGHDPILVEPVPGEALAAIVPTWRRDIAIEADLAEEVARLSGYEQVPATLPDTALPPWRASPLEVRDAVREALAGAGLTEVVTYALVSPRHVDTFRLRKDVPSVDGEPDPVPTPVVVTNPLSRDHSVLRRGLIGSLLDVVADNVRHGRADIPIFEAGKGYGRKGTETREWWRIGLALTGAAEPAAWNRPARPFDIDDAKGLAELLFRRLGFDQPAYEAETDEPLFHPGRTARVTARRSRESGSPAGIVLAGIIGELHPDLLERWEVRAERVVVAELAIAGLAGGQLEPVRSFPPARHPAVQRDLAVVIAEARPAADVAEVIQRAGGPLLQAVELFDIYRGAPLPSDQKSLAHRLTFAAADRTLTEAEVDEAVAAVSAALARDLGGRLRT